MNKSMTIFALIIFSITSFAQYSLSSYKKFESTVNLGYNARSFSKDGKDEIKTRIYGGSLTYYLSSATGIELSYIEQYDDITNNASVTVSGVTITKTLEKIHTKTMSVGIKQGFYLPDSVVRPEIAIGYARDMGKSEKEIYVSGALSPSEYVVEKNDQDNVYITGTLKIMVTPTTSISGSVKTTFPFKDPKQAENNIKFIAGAGLLF